MNLPYYPEHVRKIVTAHLNPGMNQKIERCINQDEIEVDKRVISWAQLPFHEWCLRLRSQLHYVLQYPRRETSDVSTVACTEAEWPYPLPGTRRYRRYQCGPMAAASKLHATVVCGRLYPATHTSLSCLQLSRSVRWISKLSTSKRRRRLTVICTRVLRENEDTSHHPGPAHLGWCAFPAGQFQGLLDSLGSERAGNVDDTD